jgi:TRAP-type C4-dicarboxylate transport system permease small subunit
MKLMPCLIAGRRLLDRPVKPSDDWFGIVERFSICFRRLTKALNMTTAEKDQPVEAQRSAYRRAMDALYFACVFVAGIALVLISAVIPWAVYTRYVLNQAASWPEPMAVLLTIVLTFFGAAACYRRRLHMNVSFFVAMLPPPLRRIADLIAELLVALFALFMVIWGAKLVDATWYNTIADFPALSVGVTYLPIPLGGAILLLFVIEHVIGGAPPLSVSEHAHPMAD